MFCECRNIIKHYDGRCVLNVPELVLPAGKITAIVGANGSGKTTLLEIMALLTRPDGGTLRPWGAPAEFANAQARQSVVMVMHPGYMFRGDVWHNMMFGLKARGVPHADAQTRARDALAMVGLLDFAHRSAATLSAGERQRVNIARALAVQPRAMLFDEPVVNVDTQSVDIIRGLLVRLRDTQGTTIVHTSASGDALEDISDTMVRMVAGTPAPCLAGEQT